MKDPKIRARVIAEMKVKPVGWDNLYYQAASPDRVLFLEFKNPALKQYTGKTLAEVAKLRGTSPEDTAIDLVIEDGTRVGTAYFLMDEANVARQTALPWMSFGSDAEASAPRGKFLLSSTHPRAYGNVARLLGKYVRDEHRLSLAEAVRKLTSLPDRQPRHQGSRAGPPRHDGRSRHLRSRDRSPTRRLSSSHSNSRSGCATCSSTASPSCSTAK